MKHVDNVISEKLRPYQPPIKFERQAGVEYKRGDTGVTIRKEMMISFPVFGMIKGSEFYPEPEKCKHIRCNWNLEINWVS